MLAPGVDPPFQYILATPTRLNKTLAKEPYLCLILDRHNGENGVAGSAVIVSQEEHHAA